MIRINLAPVEARRRRGPGFTLPALPVGLGMLFAVLYVVAVLGVGYSWWSLIAETSRLIAENDRTAKETDTLKATLGAGGNVKAQLADVRKRVQVIEELVQGQGRPIQLLDAFVDTVPRDLWITSFEDRGASLKIAGTAYSTRAGLKRQKARFCATPSARHGRATDSELRGARRSIGLSSLTPICTSTIYAGRR